MTYTLIEKWTKQREEEEEGEEDRKGTGKCRGKIEQNRIENKKMALKH